MIEQMETLGIVDVVEETDAPSVDVSTLDYNLFPASELITSYSSSNLSVASDLLKETVSGVEKEFIRITPGSSTTSKDNTQVIFKLNEIGADFLIKDYTHMVVGYRTNTAASSAVFDFNAVIKRDGAYSRHWGLKYNPTRDGAIHYVYLPLADEISGGEVTGYVSFDDIDDDSLITQLYLKPWGGNAGAAMVDGEYVDIEFVGFFKTASDAGAYVQNEKYIMSQNSVLCGDIDGNGAVETNDSVVIARYLAKWSGYSELINMDNSDLDGDNAVTSNDSVIIARYLAKWSGYETLPYVS